MSAEHQQCKGGAGLSPCVSRDSKNNEKLSAGTSKQTAGHFLW